MDLSIIIWEGEEIDKKLKEQLAAAEEKAWQALGRNKYWMFGYYAARVVFIRQMLSLKGRSPFYELVAIAKMKGESCERDKV